MNHNYRDDALDAEQPDEPHGINRVYQILTRADRQLAPETHKKPWLAGMLSLLIVGAGQLYNRQLRRGIVLFLFFYLVGTGLFILYWPLNMFFDLGERLPELPNAYRTIFGGLWFFAVVD